MSDEWMVIRKCEIDSTEVYRGDYDEMNALFERIGANWSETFLVHIAVGPRSDDRGRIDHRTASPSQPVAPATPTPPRQTTLDLAAHHIHRLLRGSKPGIWTDGARKWLRDNGYSDPYIDDACADWLGTGNATPPEVRLDELRAAAERVLATLSPSDRGVDDDAIALATFVRDLLSEQPTIGWIERTWHCSEDEDYQVVSIGEGDPFDLVTARRLAADLLRAAEQAESSASQAVHPGSRPAGEEGK